MYFLPDAMLNSFLYDFQDGKGAVPASRHENPDGKPGGLVAKTAWVDPTVYIDVNTRVLDQAMVLDQANLISSIIGGRAVVAGDATGVNMTLMSGTMDQSYRRRWDWSWWAGHAIRVAKQTLLEDVEVLFV